MNNNKTICCLKILIQKQKCIEDRLMIDTRPNLISTEKLSEGSRPKRGVYKYSNKASTSECVVKMNISRYLDKKIIG